MANVIIFTDLPPRDLGLTGDPFYLRYQSKTAGGYAIATVLRNLGYSVMVVNHCASYTLKGIKKVITDNSQDLLWVGISTSFFTTGFPPNSPYKETWATSDELFFDDWLSVLTAKSNLFKKNDYVHLKRELIWGGKELSLIAEFCDQVGVPFLIGGAWVSNIRNGNLYNLHKNAHIISGRAETVAVEITNSLSSNKHSKFNTVANNSHFDDVDFKQTVYQWRQEDNITPNDWLPIQISRGCAFNCMYCGYDRRAQLNSYRSPEALYTELVRNYEEFGVTRYILMDDLYNETKEKVRTLYDKVWSRLPFKPEWTSYMRLDLIWADKESAEIIKASGARQGSFGIETMNTAAGKRVGKGLGKERTLELLEHVRSVWQDDTILHGYFIAGLPDEPEESILETIEWLKTSDLLHTSSWAPLWVTPPEHKKFVISTSPMSKDQGSYGFTWLTDNNWVNNQGITFTRAQELANLGNAATDFFIGAFGDYPEYRQLGWSHQDIMYLKDCREKCVDRLIKDTPGLQKRIHTQIKHTLKTINEQ